MADEAPVVIDRHADMVDVITTPPVEPEPVVDPVEGIHDASLGKPENEASTDPEDPPLPEEKDKRKNGAQARIDELTRKAAEATRRAAKAEEDLAAIKSPPSPADAPAKPTPDQYEDYGDYVEALTDWKADQRDAKRAETEATRAHEAAATDRNAAWQAKVGEAASTIPDYNEVVGTSDIPIKDHVAEALMEADKGPELAYHLASHPEVADRLNTMSPMQAAIELGRIEATLGGPTPRATTRAPAPITPITPGPSGKVNLQTADQETYMAERRKQGARW